MPLSRPKSDPIALILHLPVASYFWVHRKPLQRAMWPHMVGRCFLSALSLTAPASWQFCKHVRRIQHEALCTCCSSWSERIPTTVWTPTIPSVSPHNLLLHLFMFSILLQGTRPCVGTDSYLIAVFLEPRPSPISSKCSENTFFFFLHLQMVTIQVFLCKTDGYSNYNLNNYFSLEKSISLLYFRFLSC